MTATPPVAFAVLADDPHAVALAYLYAAMRRLEPDADGSDPATLAVELAADEMMRARMAAGEPFSGLGTMAHALVLLARMCGASVTIDDKGLAGCLPVVRVTPAAAISP